MTRFVVPIEKNWQRRSADRSGVEWIITMRDGQLLRTKVVRTTKPRFRRGGPVNSLKAFRRALAHGTAGYYGLLECKVCHGEDPECRFCTDGIPRHVCGDCNQPLPACPCFGTMRQRVSA